MANFWQIKRQSHYMAAIEFKKMFPELKRLSSEEIEQRLRDSELVIVVEEKVKTPVWVRFTLPFALIFIVVVTIFLPLKYMITGKWGFSKDWIYNWFKALGF